jgi:hypothetical protein
MAAWSVEDQTTLFGVILLLITVGSMVGGIIYGLTHRDDV